MEYLNLNINEFKESIINLLKLNNKKKFAKKNDIYNKRKNYNNLKFAIKIILSFFFIIIINFFSKKVFYFFKIIIQI